jgi:hypothetical protein
VLVDGAAGAWAVCLGCQEKDQKSVSGWRNLGFFFAKVLTVLLFLILVLAWLSGDIG